MVQKKILGVDDDLGSRLLLHRFLARKNFQVKSVGSGATALEHQFSNLGHNEKWSF